MRDNHPMMPMIVLNTFEAVTGINFWTKCYPIMVDEPDSWPTFIQAAGRANREDFRAKKNVGLVTTEAFMATETYKDILIAKFTQDESDGK